MALLQVHQAKALRDLHEGGHDPQVHHELRAVTDLALQATKVTARAVERHLWLCLADMRDTDKVRFLNSPVSQTGLFGDAVENFAQQFSAVQKQSEPHPAPAVRCCMHSAAGSTSACSSPRVTPCDCPRSRAAATASTQAAPWSQS